MQTPPLPDLATRNSIRAALLTFRHQNRLGFEKMAKLYLLPSIPSDVLDAYDGKPLTVERVKRALHGWVVEQRDIAQHPWLVVAVARMLEQHGSKIVRSLADPTQVNRELASNLKSFVAPSRPLAPPPVLPISEWLAPGLYEFMDQEKTVNEPYRYLSLYDIGIKGVMVAHNFRCRGDDGLAVASRRSGFLFGCSRPSYLFLRSLNRPSFSAWMVYLQVEPSEAVASVCVAGFTTEDGKPSKFKYSLVPISDADSAQPALRLLAETLRSELV